MARSKHWGETHKWVKQIVKSAKTPEQQKSAQQLIWNWYDQTYRHYPKLGYIMMSELKRELDMLLYATHTS